MLSVFNNLFTAGEIDWGNNLFPSNEQLISFDETQSDSFDETPYDSLYGSEEKSFRRLKCQRTEEWSSANSPCQAQELTSHRTQLVMLSSGFGEIGERLFDEGIDQEEYESSYEVLDSSFTFHELSGSSEGETACVLDFDDHLLDYSEMCTDIQEEQMCIDRTEYVQGPSEESRVLQERIRFFTYTEPKQWFSLMLDTDNKITTNIPSSIGRVKKIIYVFRNTENNMWLIGKTGQSFSGRLSGYKQAFNSFDRDDFEEEGGIADVEEFVADVRKNPEKFEVGILHALTEEEDLNDFETQFIDHQETIRHLYNKRKGGAGGLARSEERLTSYAIPKDSPITPIKRYPYKTNENGQIRLDLTPGFHRTIKKLSQSRTSPEQGFLYSIKSLSSNKRYIGGTMQESPTNRLRQHGYDAEVFHAENEIKFDPNASDGALHPAMGENPLDFTVGFLPVRYDVGSMSEEEKAKYHILPSLGDAEKKTIEVVGSLISQGGFNCNKGGGGPIADCKKRTLSTKRKAFVLDEVVTE